MNDQRNPNLASDIDLKRSRTPVLDATEKRIETEREANPDSLGTPPSMPTTRIGGDGLTADPHTSETVGGKGGLQGDPVLTSHATAVPVNNSTHDIGTNGASHDSQASTLLASDKADSFGKRWTDIQSNFVDEPQEAVRNADGLVSEVIQELSHRFAQERQGLEHQWSGGGDVSTEDLRMALRHYRDFFQRLLAT